MFLHRNSQKRIYGKWLIYFITTNAYHGFEYFCEPMFCDLLVENLRFCKKLKRFELYAFCILYDHLHLLLKPGDKYNISKIIKSFKENTSRDINRVLQPMPEGGTPASRLRVIYQNKGINLKFYRRKFIEVYGCNQIKIPPFRWQESYHDHVIRGPRDFINHYHYTVYNFQKHGLPNNWQYTSLKYSNLIDEIDS